MSKTQVPLSQIRDNPHQPRIDVGDVESLAESILQHGVRQLPEGRLLIDGDQPSYSEYTTADSGTWYLDQDEYAIVELASGHRRTEAIRLLNEDDTVTDGDLKGAGLVPGYVPVDMQRLSDEEMLDLGTIENVQRKDLSPIEEARQIQEHKGFGRTNAEIGEIFGGRSPSWVSNRTRLLDLPQEVQVAVHEDEISTRQGQALARAFQLKEEHPDRVESLPFEIQPTTLAEDARQGVSSEKIREKAQTMEETIEAMGEAPEDENAPSLPFPWEWAPSSEEVADHFHRAVRPVESDKIEYPIFIEVQEPAPAEQTVRNVVKSEKQLNGEWELPPDSLLPAGWIWVGVWTPYSTIDWRPRRVHPDKVKQKPDAKEVSTASAAQQWYDKNVRNKNQRTTDTDGPRPTENDHEEDEDGDDRDDASAPPEGRPSPSDVQPDGSGDAPQKDGHEDRPRDPERVSSDVSRIVLVACSKSKMNMAQQAQGLYKGQLFIKSKAYAKQMVESGEADAWYILSAKHGLLEPMETVEPYDETLADADGERRIEWAADVYGELQERCDLEATELVVLGGRDYYQPLDGYPNVKHDLEAHVTTPFSGMAGNGEMMQWLDERTEEDIYTEPTAREMREQPSGDGAPAEATGDDSGHDIGDRYGDIEMAMASCEDAGFSWHVGTKAQGGYYAHVTDHDDEVHEVEGGDTAAGALFDAYMAAKEDTDSIGPVDPDTVDQLLSADGIDMWDEDVAAEASIPSLLVAHRVAGARQETWRTRLIAEAVQEREGTVTEEDIPDEAMAEVEAEVKRRLETQAA